MAQRQVRLIANPKLRINGAITSVTIKSSHRRSRQYCPTRKKITVDVPAPNITIGCTNHNEPSGTGPNKMRNGTKANENRTRKKCTKPIVR